VKASRHIIKYHRGFTVVELLIAMAITSILMIVLLSIVGQSTNTNQRTQRAVNGVSESRALMQLIAQEISTRFPETPILHIAGANDSPATSDQFAFIRTLSADERNTTTPGDLGTSAYYVAFAPSQPNAVTPRLFRKNLNPVATQQLLDAAGGPAFPQIDINADEPIFENVLSFQARPKFFNPSTGIQEDWTLASPLPPSSVELTIRFIDESTSRRFKAEGDWNRLASTPTIQEVGLIQTFSRTIAIAR
jgi:prepilin-type N-terminal cleavage/methylation domain-containing protein